MPVPKFRTSRSKRDMRRSHHALKLKSNSQCPNCGSVKHPHAVCGSCGYYRGKQVMEPTQSSFEVGDSFEPTAEA